MSPLPAGLPEHPRIAFLGSNVEGAQAALEAMARAYGQCEPADADVLVALGGDGFMLQALHRHDLCFHERNRDASRGRLFGAGPAGRRPAQLLGEGTRLRRRAIADLQRPGAIRGRRPFLVAPGSA